MPERKAALSVPSYSVPIVNEGCLPFVNVHCGEKCTSYLLVKMRWQYQAMEDSVVFHFALMPLYRGMHFSH